MAGLYTNLEARNWANQSPRYHKLRTESVLSIVHPSATLSKENVKRRLHGKKAGVKLGCRGEHVNYPVRSRALRGRSRFASVLHPRQSISTLLTHVSTSGLIVQG